MQDFTRYNYNITIKDLKQALNIVDNIIVIINGEYYQLIPDSDKKPDSVKGVQ